MSVQSGARAGCYVAKLAVPLAIVVPAYNEAELVTDTVCDIRRTMLSHGMAYSLILVDDGSTDDTAIRLAALAAEEPATTQIVTHSRNLGLGRAIVSGYAAAIDAAWVGWLPADGQFCADDFYRLFAERDGRDAVLGRVKARARESADSLARVVVSWSSRALMRLLHPRMPRFNGIMVVRRECIVSEKLICRTGFVNMEILDRLRRQGRNRFFGERQVRVLPRRTGHSKVANLRTTLAVLRDLAMLRVHYMLHRNAGHGRAYRGMEDCDR